LPKEGKNEARDGKEQGNEGVGLKGIEGSGTGGVARGNGEKGVVEKRGVVEEVELRNIDDTAFSNDHLSINFTIPDSSRGHIKATATSPLNQDFFRSRRSAEKRGSQTNNYQSLLAKSKERHSRGCVSVDKQPAGEESRLG
jgi:hypothetical protein